MNEIPKVPESLQSVNPSSERKFWVVPEENGTLKIFLSAGGASAFARTRAQVLRNLTPNDATVYVFEAVQAYRNEGTRVIEITMTKDVETPKP